MSNFMDLAEKANNVSDLIDAQEAIRDFAENKDSRSGNRLAGIICNLSFFLPKSLCDRTVQEADKIGEHIQEHNNNLNNPDSYFDRIENGGIYGTPKIEIPKNIQGNLNKNRPNFAINSYDPLVFDLNGDDKINLINSQTYFDYEGDGIKEAGYWLDKTDGFLAYDRNNNGTIDDASELFGNFTPIDENNELAKDGYEALAKFDTNNDDIIDANDTEFNNLQIWQDLNLNGISESNELKSLSEFNIESLNLNNFTNLNLFVA